jgi:hypothetical protein
MIDADNSDAQGHRYLHQGVVMTLNRPLLEHQRKHYVRVAEPSNGGAFPFLESLLLLT